MLVQEEDKQPKHSASEMNNNSGEKQKEEGQQQQQNPESGAESESESPRGVLEIPIMAGDSDTNSNSSCSNNSTSNSNSNSLSDKTTTPLSSSSGKMQWRSVFEAIKRRSTMPLENIYRRRSTNLMRRRLARIRSADDGVGRRGRVDLEEVDSSPVEEGPKPSWRTYDHAELAAATSDFSPVNLLGKGGQAEVYKGCLLDGQIVAVKKLIKKEKEKEERIGDFLSELGIIAHIDHPNAARLLGFGVDGGCHLVLEFSPHGSLASLLFGSECLEWKIRFNVAIGVAKGLQYLHHNCPRRIIHRDIKASNILLTRDYEPQISDFGLAKWLPEKWTHHVVFPIEGTFGYLAPEYFMHGIIDEKTDVFAFGVLLLELITGRRAVDSSQQSLVIWAKPLLIENNVTELADPRLSDNFDQAEMKRLMLTASLCLHHQATKRPYMNRVVKLLQGEDGQIELKPKYTQTRSVMFEACDMEDYTCTTYLSDLNRHRQLVME